MSSLLPTKKIGVPLLVFLVVNICLVCYVGVKEIEIPFMFIPQVGALVSILYLGMWLPKKLKGKATTFEVETPT
jgi:hypothetical protein